MNENTFKKILTKKNKIGFIVTSVQKDKWIIKNLKKLKNASYLIHPINPKCDQINGDGCFPNLQKLIEFPNEKPDYVITIIPLILTEKLVE